jgi:hypothetical protein
VNFLGNKEKTRVSIAATKGLGNSHFLLVTEKATRNRSSELSYYEVIIPARKESDFFSNIRIPMYVARLQ